MTPQGTFPYIEKKPPKRKNIASTDLRMVHGDKRYLLLTDPLWERGDPGTVPRVLKQDEQIH